MITLDAQHPPVRVINAEGQGRFCLVCEHASPRIPQSLGNMGLADEDRLSHAVWDPGAMDLALTLSDMLDAPLVAGGYSRLVWDLNRPWGAPSATQERVERISVPANASLSEAARETRYQTIYTPFDKTLSTLLDACDVPPVLVTLHTFSPVWFGAARATEIGVLHAAEPAFVTDMVAARPHDGPSVAVNQPYSAADGVTHTLERHADARGLPSVMIEVRNDLVATPHDCADIATLLETMLRAAESARSD